MLEHELGLSVIMCSTDYDLDKEKKVCRAFNAQAGRRAHTGFWVSKPSGFGVAHF